MKYIKLFEKFDMDFPPNMNFHDIKDIFGSVCDFGMRFHDVNLTNIASMGGKDIIEDHNELDITNIKRALMISLVMVRESHRNSDFDFSDDFYEELELTIEHFESRYNCKLSNIYVQKNKVAWVKDVDNFKKYIESLSEASLSWISSIDISFELNDSIDY